MAEELTALRRGLAAPCQIALGGEPCRIEEIHRLLPGKRVAARGHFRGQEGFVKLFVGRGAGRRCRRERRGLARLRANGLNAPQLLCEVCVAKPRGWALVFEFLSETRPIAFAPPALAEAEAALATEALARLHGCGAVHRDPHRSNFLVGGGNWLRRWNTFDIIEMADPKALLRRQVKGGGFKFDDGYFRMIAILARRILRRQKPLCARAVANRLSLHCNGKGRRPI